MDYGRLAYERLDELEARLNASLLKTEREKSASLCAFPGFYLNGQNPFNAAKIYSVGAGCLIIKIKADVLACGIISINADGVCLARVGFASIGTKDEIIFCRADGGGVKSLVLNAEGGFEGVINEFSLFAYGAGVSVSREHEIFAADFDAASGVTAVLSGSDLSARLALIKDNLQTDVLLGVGTCGDLTAADGCFKVILSDGAGNMWGTTVAADGTKSGDKRICGGAENASVTYADGLLYIAYAQSGKIYYFSCELDFNSVTAPELIEIPFYCDRLAFIKNSEKPYLLIESGGKCFIKQTLQEPKASDTITAAFSSVFS